MLQPKNNPIDKPNAVPNRAMIIDSQRTVARS